MPEKTKKSMAVAEFRSEGYLQELNRRFLHPFGIALETEAEADGTERLTVRDYRDEPQRARYDDASLWQAAAHVSELWCDCAAERHQALGYTVQLLKGH